MSNAIEKDNLIIDYCNKNLNDPKCGCLLFKKNFKFLNKSTISSYVCWYAPCLNSENYFTSLISNEKKLCNINICEVSLGDIDVKDTNITINNDCISLISPMLFFKESIRLINNYEVSNMFIKSFFIPIIILLIIFLIY
jgi:hypothetical protein